MNPETTSSAAELDLATAPDDVWLYGQGEQLARAHASGSTESIPVQDGDTEADVVIVTTRGARSGQPRETVLIRVEHEGSYALIASKAGAARHPAWYHNVRASAEIEIWDVRSHRRCTVREVDGAERQAWWERAAAVWPVFTRYQDKTTRVIPVLVATPAGGTEGQR